MSRSINQIYEEAVAERNKRLELSEYASDSKLSILNGITWSFAAVVFSFEAILDLFAVDIAKVINNRINGTPTPYDGDGYIIAEIFRHLYSNKANKGLIYKPLFALLCSLKYETKHNRQILMLYIISKFSKILYFLVLLVLIFNRLFA